MVMKFREKCARFAGTAHGMQQNEREVVAFNGPKSLKNAEISVFFRDFGPGQNLLPKSPQTENSVNPGRV